MLGSAFRGKKIWQGRGSHHLLSIWENKRYRWLRFGSENIQSAIDIRHPQRLTLAYLKVMMGTTLFLDSLQRAVVLGYGGGSIVRALRQQYPKAKITAVDLESELFSLSKRYFDFDAKAAKVNTVCADAAAYIAQSRDPIDCLFVDVFHDAKMPRFTREVTFLSNCYNSLSENGIMAMNILTHHREEFWKIYDKVHRFFSHNTLVVDVKNYQNMVLFASKDENFRKRVTELVSAKKIIGASWDPHLGLVAEKLVSAN